MVSVLDLLAPVHMVVGGRGRCRVRRLHDPGYRCIANPSRNPNLSCAVAAQAGTCEVLVPGVRDRVKVKARARVGVRVRVRAQVSVRKLYLGDHC